MAGARLRMASAVAVCALLFPGSAHAADPYHAAWSGYGWSSCESGPVSGWTCHYFLTSQQYPELAVVGTTLASCQVEIHATARIAPLLNAAGRVAGCTSVGLAAQTGGHVSFGSTFPGLSNERIDSPFRIDVHDAVGGNSVAVLAVTATESGGEQQNVTWVADAGMPASCARSSFYTASATGNVDVYVG